MFFVQTLIKLDLSGQEINDDGIEYLAKSLPDNKVIWMIFLFR